MTEFLIQQFGPLSITAVQARDILENKTRKLVLNPDTSRLSVANKAALKHLVAAAKAIDSVFLKQNHQLNERIKNALNAIAPTANDQYVSDLHTLFGMFNGAEGSDLYAPKTVPLRLFEKVQLNPGKGFYPSDITQDELCEYLLVHPEQAAVILGNNTLVVRDAARLVAIPYSVAFRTEFEECARELLLAAALTDHVGFASFLRYQAQALVNGLI